MLRECRSRQWALRAVIIAIACAFRCHVQAARCCAQRAGERRSWRRHHSAIRFDRTRRGCGAAAPPAARGMGMCLQPLFMSFCAFLFLSVWCAFLCCAKILIRLASGLPCLLRVRAAGAFASGDPTRRLGTCVQSQDGRTAGRISRSANALLARGRSWRVRVPRGPAPPFPRTPSLLSAVPEDGFNRESRTGRATWPAARRQPRRTGSRRQAR